MEALPKRVAFVVPGEYKMVGKFLGLVFQKVAEKYSKLKEAAGKSKYLKGLQYFDKTHKKNMQKNGRPSS